MSGERIICIDTNVYVDVLIGSEKAFQYFVTATRLIVPAIVIGELEYGFLNGNNYQENHKNLQRFLAGPNIHIGIIRKKTSIIYANIKSRLKKSGKPIPENDIWIAAITFENQAKLLSRDRHFDFVEDLERIY